MHRISYTALSQEDAESEDDEVILAARPFPSFRYENIIQKLAKYKRAIILFLSCLIIIVTSGVSIGLGSYALFIVKPRPQVDLSVQAFAIPNHLAWQRWNALKHAFSGHRDKRSIDRNEFDSVDRGAIHRLRRSYSCDDKQFLRGQRIFLVYLAQGEENNIFTEKRIEEIHRIEQRIANLTGFRDVCFMNLRDCDCVPINSILTYFYPSQISDGQLLPDGRGSRLLNIDTALSWALSSSPFAYWYTDGRLSAKFHQSRFLRSEVQFGKPLQGYVSTDDRKAEQDAKFLEFAVQLRDFLSTASTREVKVLYGGTDLFDYEVKEVFWNDLRLSIFSVAFIIIFVFTLTSFSIWLTFWGIAAILLSFPLAFFFYRVAFNMVNMGILNGIAAFVIIGIGVDDVFVFINTFRQSCHIKDLLKRIRHTAMTAGKATFFTSFTTAAAFAANISSSIPAVHDFGLFMTLIVTCCWLLVVLMMPPVIIIWSEWFGCCESTCFACCWKCKIRDKLKLPADVSQFLQCHSSHPLQPSPSCHRDSDDDDVALLRFEEPDVLQGVLELNPDGESAHDDPLLLLEEEIQSEAREAEAKKRKEGCDINSWFQGLLYYCVALPVIKARVFIAVIFVGLLVVSIGFITQMHLASKPPQLFRPDTNLQMLLDLMANYSSSSGLSCDDCSGYNKPPATPNPAPLPTSSTRPPVDTRPATDDIYRLTTPSGARRSFTTYTTMVPSASNSFLLPIFTSSPTLGYSTSATSFVSTPSTPSTNAKPSTIQRALSSSSTMAKTASATSSVDLYRNTSWNPCDGSQCKDHPPLETGILVYVVFGIKGVNQTSDHVLPDQMETIYDDEFYERFQFTNLNISDLCRLCKEISNENDLVLPNTTQCWPSGSVFEMESLSRSEINECQNVPRYYMDEKGNWKQSQVLMGYDSKGIRWISFSFRATTYKGHSSFEAYKKYQKWELFMTNLIESLPSDSPLRSMYQTSDFWQQMMMEVIAVSSAIYGLVLSLLICIVAVGVFTGHFLLLLITILTLVGLISLVLAVFFWAGWELGAIEAISLSILVGSSVDYCIHIVEGYLLAGRNPPSLDDASMRKWRTSVAVSHIGTSVVSSAVTTIMAAIPLTHAVLMPFSRFGQIVALNTAVSIVYALTSCVAFLSLFAPARFTNGFRSAGIMLLLLAVCAGLFFLVLYIISRGGISIPAPNGEDLFPK